MCKYYQTITKKKDYRDQVASILRRNYLYTYAFCEGILIALMLLVHLATNKLSQKTWLFGITFDKETLNNIFIIFIYVIIIWTFCFTIYTAVRFRRTFSLRWIDRNICSLPWYIGETKDAILLLNMDHYIMDENTNGNHFKDIQQAQDHTGSILEQVPDTSPFLVHSNQHLKTLRDARMKTLYQLAINEICTDQTRLQNQDFFSKPDYWNYYLNS